MIIDSHIHLWDPSRRHYPWLHPESPELARPFEVAEFEGLSTSVNVHAAVLVQTVSSLEETREFLGIARSSAKVAGVVGWVDLTAPSSEAVVDLRREFGQHLVGVRHQVEDEVDVHWLDRPEVRSSLERLADLGMPFDVLVREDQMPSVLRLARDLPELILVLDHLGKPNLSPSNLLIWDQRLRELAAAERTFIKLSGFMTLEGAGQLSTEHVTTLFERFTPARVMFGSDWPVSTTAMPYSDLFRVTEQLLDQLSMEERRQVLGETAISVYQLDKAMSVRLVSTY